MFRFGRSVAEFLRRLNLRSTEGVAAVEMAFIAPILVGMLIVTWDFGRFSFQVARVTSAASAGAQFLFHTDDDIPGMEQAVRDDARDDNNLLQINTNEFCECPGAVTVLCTATCGNPPEAPARFINVQVTGSVALLFDYNFAANPVPITKQAVVRVQ